MNIDSLFKEYFEKKCTASERLTLRDRVVQALVTDFALYVQKHINSLREYPVTPDKCFSAPGKPEKQTGFEQRENLSWNEKPENYPAILNEAKAAWEKDRYGISIGKLVSTGRFDETNARSFAINNWGAPKKI